MNFWRKIALILTIGTFPISILILHQNTQEKPVPTPLKNQANEKGDLERTFQKKAEMLSKIDLRIISAKGELMKFEKNRIDVLSDLIDLKEKLEVVIQSHGEYISIPEETSDKNDKSTLPLIEASLPP